MDVEDKNTSREIRQEGIVLIQARDDDSFEESGNCRGKEDFCLSNWKSKVTINNNWKH